MVPANWTSIRGHGSTVLGLSTRFDRSIAPVRRERWTRIGKMIYRREGSIRFRPSALLCGVERITQSRRPGQSRVFDTVHHHVESGGYASLIEHGHSDFEVVSVSIVKGNCHRPGRRFLFPLHKKQNISQSQGIVIASNQFHLLAKNLRRMDDTA